MFIGDQNAKAILGVGESGGGGKENNKTMEKQVDLIGQSEG